MNDIIYKSFFMFLFYTGAGQSKAQALSWKDINFNTKYISISKTLSNKIKGKNYEINTPKTANSKRKFKITDKLVDQLKLLMTYYKSMEGFSNDWFIFGGINLLKNSSLQFMKLYF